MSSRIGASGGTKSARDPESPILFERLEQVGLVERRTDERDARASNAVLTEAGLRRLRAARRTHHEIIRRRFLGFLSQAEMRQLGTLWHEILGPGRPS